MTPTLFRLVFLVHLAATLYMVGLIWFVQVVHYPLFSRVGTKEYVQYQRVHMRTTTWVVAAPMIVEAVTALILAIAQSPELDSTLLWVGFCLVLVLWISTAVLQIPVHNKLTLGFEGIAHRRLVSTNWLRTVVWSVRGGLVLYMTSNLIGK